MAQVDTCYLQIQVFIICSINFRGYCTNFINEVFQCLQVSVEKLFQIQIHISSTVQHYIYCFNEYNSYPFSSGQALQLAHAFLLGPLLVVKCLGSDSVLVVSLSTYAVFGGPS